MKTSKLFLLVTFALTLFMIVPAMAFVPTFTGNVETDFPAGPGVLIVVDPGGQEVSVTGQPGGGLTPGSGWDIKDLRLAYDNVNDILYVGLNSYNIVGDADGDGDPGNETWGGGTDFADLASSETVAVYFDLDMVGPFSMSNSWDVIVGVGGDMIFSDFGIYNTRLSGSPTSNFQFPASTYPNGKISGHDGLTPTNPSASSPDWEFSITDFSTLLQDSAIGVPDVDPGSFRVGAFMGSIEDGAIGEDYIYYHQVPSTITTITPSADAVIEGGTVNLVVTEENDSEAFSGELAGPSVPQPYAFFPATVAVTQNGSPISGSPFGTPADSGDAANASVLDIGETWTWGTSTTITSAQINASTTFVAHGNGTGPQGFVHTYVQDADEEAQVDVEVLSTDVGITADPEAVECDETFDLTVTEENDGSANLTNVSVVVNDGTTDIATLIAPPTSGDTDADSELDPGETWTWDATTVAALNDIGPLSADTTYTATGSADYDDGVNPVITVTYPGDLDEQASVTVTWACADTVIDIKANGSDGPITVCEDETVTLTICEENIGDVDLTGPYVELYAGTTLVGTYDDSSAEFTGGDTDGDSELDADTPGETWCWDVDVVVTDPTTTFSAIAYGYINGILVTWCETPASPPADTICDQDERDEVVVNTEECGGEGCTPGFWKNNAEKWGAIAWVGYSPDDSFSSVFGVVITIFTGGNPNKSSSYITDPTLLEALGANGGGINALARHAVAALLNTSSPCVQYAYSSVSALIADVYDAIVSGDEEAIQSLHEDLAYYNEAGCPVNQHGECSHPID